MKINIFFGGKRKKEPWHNKYGATALYLFF